MKNATYDLIEKTLKALKEEYPRELSDSQLATGDPDFPPLILAARDALAALFGWESADDMDAWLSTPCEYDWSSVYEGDERERTPEELFGYEALCEYRAQEVEYYENGFVRY